VNICRPDVPTLAESLQALGAQLDEEDSVVAKWALAQLAS
jgi:hypothetical protein